MGLENRRRDRACLTKAVERRRALGVGYSGGQLCHLPESHHGSLYVMIISGLVRRMAIRLLILSRHRVSSQPSIGHERRVHCRVGDL